MRPPSPATRSTPWSPMRQKHRVQDVIRSAGRAAEKRAAGLVFSMAISRLKGALPSSPGMIGCSLPVRRGCLMARMPALRQSQSGQIRKGDRGGDIRHEGPAGGPGYARDAGHHGGHSGRGAG